MIQLPAGAGVPGCKLDALDRAAVGECVATDEYTADGAQYPMVLVESAGLWGQAQELQLPADRSTDSQTSDLDGVSCWGAGDCEAAGYYTTHRALVAMGAGEQNGVWGQAIGLSDPNHSYWAELDGVACPAAADCQAVGGYGVPGNGTAPMTVAFGRRDGELPSRCGHRPGVANRRMAEMLGYSEREMIGQPLDRFMDEGSRALAEGVIARGRQSHHSAVVERRLQHKDGSDVWRRVSTTPLYDDAGEVAGATHRSRYAKAPYARPLHSACAREVAWRSTGDPGKGTRSDRRARRVIDCDNQGMPHPERYLGAMRVVEDAAEVARAGGWVISATHGSTEVRCLVPEVFEDYARIFHPAMREADERDLPLRATGESKTGVPVYTRDYGVPWPEVSWREVAEANGRVAHPAMQWISITGSYEFGWSGMQPGLWERVPQHDSLPLRLTRVLCEILAAFTSTPERCWCAVWEGYGDMVGLRSDLKLPRLAMWNRPMIVAWGLVSAVPEKSFSDGFDDASDHEEHWQSVERYRGPSLWWPDDRAWCVATDVDFQETYLGATAACVDRLLSDERLEVMRVAADQNITFDSDTINPPPTGDRTTT